MTVVHNQMKLAVQADLDALFKRRPKVEDLGLLEAQLKEMLSAERRGWQYDITAPWRSKDWHGINVPENEQDIGQSVPKPAKMQGRKTGNRRTTKGDS